MGWLRFWEKLTLNILPWMWNGGSSLKIKWLFLKQTRRRVAVYPASPCQECAQRAGGRKFTAFSFAQVLGSLWPRCRSNPNNPDGWQINRMYTPNTIPSKKERNSCACCNTDVKTSWKPLQMRPDIRQILYDFIYVKYPDELNSQR